MADQIELKTKHGLFASRIHISMRVILGIATLTLFNGCLVPSLDSALPGKLTFEREQLIVNSNFRIPKKHRLIDELVAKRNDMSDALKLPVSDEPINLFIFQDENEFRAFMKENHPEFPDRRAFFVKSDTELKVYASWGDRIAEDLRHEVAHGYLHSVVYNLPLWLDEGIAEYYEIQRGRHGFNEKHVYLLSSAFRRKDWSPDINHLQKLRLPEEMTQLDYAESWLWVHFLLESDQGNPKILQDQLARLRMAAESEPLSNFIDIQIEDSEIKVLEHLSELAKQL